MWRNAMRLITKTWLSFSCALGLFSIIWFRLFQHIFYPIWQNPTMSQTLKPMVWYGIMVSELSYVFPYYKQLQYCPVDTGHFFQYKADPMPIFFSHTLRSRIQNLKLFRGPQKFLGASEAEKKKKSQLHHFLGKKLNKGEFFTR